MPRVFSAFIEDETGMTFIEYALIAGLISIVVVGTLHSVGDILENWFFAVSGAIVDSAPGV